MTDKLIYKSAAVDAVHDGRTLAGIITRTAVDEEGEVVIAEGLDTSYSDKLGGVSVLWNHDYDKPIGKVRRLEPKGDHVYASIALAQTDRAEEALTLARAGILHFSIGFSRLDHGRPSEDEKRMWPGVEYVTRSWKIHELTLTPVPANGHAVLTQKTMERLVKEGKINYSTLAEFVPPRIGFGDEPAPARKLIGFSESANAIGFGRV
jgi:HK97 family phage prohead protease